MDKAKELTRLGFFIKDPSTRVSHIALRLLEKLEPSLKNKPFIEDSDWEEEKLIFNSVLPVPQKRNDKAPTTWETTSLEVKRIPDVRGVNLFQDY